MNKDFSQAKLLSFSEKKILSALYDLARYIEDHKANIESNHFLKLQKYHNFLTHHDSDRIQKITKEFNKVVDIDYQFQIYLMNLERILGQSLKEYDFLISTDDNSKSTKNFEVVCVLDSIRSAYNVGAMFRNAECFGAKKLYLTGLSPKADHPQVIKTAMGCEKLIDWEYIKSAMDCLAKLKNEGYKIVCVETAKQATPLDKFKVSKDEKIALFFGHEQFGLSLDLLKNSDETIVIDLFGSKNSLNVSVSQSIVLYQLTNILN
jgi:tRNA G18 (ribose-2'-O)-methylase SpoU